MKTTTPAPEGATPTDGPKTVSVFQALARLNTWIEPGPEHLADAVLAAACAWVDGGSHDLRAAVHAWREAQVERVQTSTGSFGCAADADDIRQELRESKRIIEVEGRTMAGSMLLARGCRIAFMDSRGRWCGVGSIERESGS